jgi:molecular chaperone HtpG
VLPDGGLPPYLERLMRMQQQNMPKQKRVLELNPKHDLILALRAMQEKEPESEKVTEWVNLLLNQALLAEGSPLENPAMVVQQMTSLLTEVVQRAST